MEIYTTSQLHKYQLLLTTTITVIIIIVIVIMIATLALVGHSSSDCVTIKMRYRVDVLHQPALPPIFSYWID